MIATVAPVATSVFHSWAINASRCALLRAKDATEICGEVWTGGTLGYMRTRHPSEGADPTAYARYESEIETTLAFQEMRRWYVNGLPIGSEGLPKGI